MKNLTLLLLILLPSGFVFAQQTKTCTEYLQEAQTTFEAGGIHDLVDDFQSTWGTCLNDELTTFTNEEKVQAFRLLALTYLQLDEPLKADEYIEKLFKADPEFEPNEAVDPIEFINL